MSRRSKEENACNICCNPFTKSKRTPVSCSYCNFTACSECYRKYLLNKADAHCMNNVCKRTFSREWLYQHFSKTFVNDTLVIHYADVHFELEKSLLEETSNYLHNQAQLVKMKDIERVIERLVRDEQNLKTSMNETYIKTNFFKDKEDPNEEKTLLPSLQNFVDAIWVEQNPEFNSLLRHFVSGLGGKQLLQKTQRKLLLDYCEAKYQSRIEEQINSCEELRKKHNIKQSVRCFTPKCQGYLAPDENQCHVCKHTYCKECGEECKDAAKKHTCDENTVKTLTLLQRDTKQCPSCKERIFKISGCDQMFCTNCHTAFDWQTNDIIKGRIHNPHLTEYLQKKASSIREEEKHMETDEKHMHPSQTLTIDFNHELPPNEIFHATQLMPITKIDTFIHKGILSNITLKEKDHYYLTNMRTFLQCMWNFASHVVHTDIPMFTLLPIVERYREYRISFLRGHLNESLWKRCLQSDFKSDETKRVKCECLETFLVMARDCFLSLYQTITKEKITYHDKMDHKVSVMRGALQTFYEQCIACLRWYNTESKKIATNFFSKHYNRFIFNFQAMDLAEKQILGEEALEIRSGSGNNVCNELEVNVETIEDIAKHDIPLTEREKECMQTYTVFHSYKKKLVEEVLQVYKQQKWQDVQVLQRISSIFISIFTESVFINNFYQYELLLIQAKKAKERVQLLQCIHQETDEEYQWFFHVFCVFIGQYCVKYLQSIKEYHEAKSTFESFVSSTKQMQHLLRRFGANQELCDQHTAFQDTLQAFISTEQYKTLAANTINCFPLPTIEKTVCIKGISHRFTYPVWFANWFFNMETRTFMKVTKNSSTFSNIVKYLFPYGISFTWNDKPLSVADAVCSLLFTANVKGLWKKEEYEKLGSFSLYMDAPVYGNYAMILPDKYKEYKEFSHYETKDLYIRVSYREYITFCKSTMTDVEKKESEQAWGKLERVPINKSFQDLVINHIVEESKRLKGRLCHYQMNEGKKEDGGVGILKDMETIVRPAPWMHYYMWKKCNV